MPQKIGHAFETLKVFFLCTTALFSLFTMYGSFLDFFENISSMYDE